MSNKWLLLIFAMCIAVNFEIVYLCLHPKSSINDARNCVVLKQHCGFDWLGTNCYVVKDLKTGIIRTINVAPSECDIYHKNDTIR